MAASTSSPLWPGIMMSSSTASHGSAASIASAVGPSPAVRTEPVLLEATAEQIAIRRVVIDDQ